MKHFSAQGAKVGFNDIDGQASRMVVEQVAAAGHASPLFLHAGLRDIPTVRRRMDEFAATAGC